MSEKAKGRQGTTPTDLDSTPNDITLTKTLRNTMLSTQNIPQNEIDDNSERKIPLFKNVSRDFLRLGYAVIPDKGGFSKVPFGKFSPYYDHKDENNVLIPRRSVSAGEIINWSNNHATSSGLLILASAPKGMPDLVVVDADDPAEFDWVEQTFGPTPLMVESGRIGGGRHYYYQLHAGEVVAQRNGQVGKTHNWVVNDRGVGSFKTKVDIKSNASYVVCPGSMHKSGLIYTASIPITEENILALPYFDVAKLNALLADRRAMIRPDGTSHKNYNPKNGRVSRSSYLDKMGTPGATIPQGDFAGMTPSEAALLMQVGELAKCGCPEHPSVATDSVSMRRTKEDWIVLSCHPCNTSYRYPVDGVTPFRLDIEEIEIKKGVTPSKLTLLTDDLISGKYIPAKDYAPGQSLALRAPQGAGKTEVMRFLVDSLRAEDPKAVIQSFSHLRNLSKANATRLDLPHYQSISGKITGSVAIVINSLPRLDRYYFDATGGCLPVVPDLLIIDEVEQVLRAICSGTMSSHEAIEVQIAFDYAIKTAKRVLVADADYSYFSQSYINNLRPHDPLFMVDVQTEVEWAYQQVSDKLALEHEMIEEWKSGKKLFIPTFYGPKNAQALANRLMQMRPDANVAVVSRETQHDYDLSTINTWVGGVDCLICTPTMGTGVSIDIKDHFSAIYGFFENYVGCAQDARQILHRVRAPLSNIIRFYAPDGGSHPEAFAPEILKNLLRKEKETVSMAHRLNLLTGAGDQKFPQDFQQVEVDGLNIHIHYRPEMLRFLKHFSEVMAYTRSNGAECLGPALTKYLRKVYATIPAQKQEIAPLAPAEVKVMKQEHKDAKTAVVDEYRAAVYAAEEIGIDLAQMMGEAKTQADNLKIERAYHKDFYGVCTPESLVFDDEGKGRKKARRFATMHLFAQKQGDKLLQRDSNAFVSGVAASHQRHTYFEGMLQYAVLSWFGLGALDTHVISETDIETAKVKIEKNAAYLNAFGFTVTTQTLKNPIQFLAQTLKKMGLVLDSAQYRKNAVVDAVPALSKKTALQIAEPNLSNQVVPYEGGKMARRYWLDVSSVATMQKYSAAYCKKLIASGVPLEIHVVDVPVIQLTPELERSLMEDLLAI